MSTKSTVKKRKGTTNDNRMFAVGFGVGDNTACPVTFEFIAANAKIRNNDMKTEIARCFVRWFCLWRS